MKCFYTFYTFYFSSSFSPSSPYEFFFFSSSSDFFFFFFYSISSTYISIGFSGRLSKLAFTYSLAFFNFTSYFLAFSSSSFSTCSFFALIPANIYSCYSRIFLALSFLLRASSNYYYSRSSSNTCSKSGTIIIVSRSFLLPPSAL